MLTGICAASDLRLVPREIALPVPRVLYPFWRSDRHSAERYQLKNEL